MDKDSVHPKVPCKNCELLFPQSRRDKQFCSNKCRYLWHSERRRKALELAIEKGEL